MGCMRCVWGVSVMGKDLVCTYLCVCVFAEVVGLIYLFVFDLVLTASCLSHILTM